LAQLEALVWEDLDRDGIQDADESGFPNVTVNLYDSSEMLVGGTITDENGLYRFSNLAPGDYFLEFVPPIGYAISPAHRHENETLDSDPSPITGKTPAIALLAGENNHTWSAGLYQLDSFRHKPEPGSVKPPPRFIKVCADGDFSVGGVAGLQVSELEPGYCLQAFLWNRRFAFGRIPEGAGNILAHITFLQIFHHGRLIQELPTEDGRVRICYAVPPGKQAQIYFYDFHRGRFAKQSGKPAWEPLDTTVENGMACAPAQETGAYALIGK
jgi:hypothetical protein